MVRQMQAEGFTGDRQRANRIVEALDTCGVRETSDIIDLTEESLSEQMCINKQEAQWWKTWREKLVTAANKKRSHLTLCRGYSPLLEGTNADGSTASVQRAIMLMRVVESNNPKRTGKHPRQATIEAAEGNHNDEQRKLWVEVARLEAICGTCTGSVNGMTSAMKQWKHFAQDVIGMKAGQELPPTVEGLTAWSRMFFCLTTYENYLRAVKAACLIGSVSTAAFSDPLIARAKKTIKALAAPPKAKQVIRHKLLLKLIEKTIEEKDEASQLLYILAYGFMLRVPSEALKVRIATATNIAFGLEEDDHSALYKKGDRMQLVLKKRKNQPHGTTIVRECWCAAEGATCPVHAIERLIQSMNEGHQPIAKISANRANSELRRRLYEMKVESAWSYCTHDFRRGHAVDLQRGGASLCTILEAGQWKTKSFADYQKMHLVEADAVLEVGTA